MENGFQRVEATSDANILSTLLHSVIISLKMLILSLRSSPDE